MRLIILESSFERFFFPHKKSEVEFFELTKRTLSPTEGRLVWLVVYKSTPAYYDLETERNARESRLPPPQESSEQSATA